MFKAVYTVDAVQYFAFCKVKDDALAVDVITGETYNMDQFDYIEHVYSNQLYKLIRRRYKVSKNKDVFKKQDQQDEHVDNYYAAFLRFFNLDNYNQIRSQVTPQIILDRVIDSLYRYAKRYLNEHDLQVYRTQLSYVKSIREALCLLPAELLENTTPFWIDILKQSQDYIFTDTPTIEKLKKLNILELSLFSVQWMSISSYDDIDIKRQEIDNNIKKMFKKACVVLIEERLKDARNVLADEAKAAQECGDSDLILEIQIIDKEITNIRDRICKIAEQFSLDGEVAQYWPELLYPIPDALFEMQNHMRQTHEHMQRLLSEVYSGT
jgi:hypothetical protein